jgi:hypothetical protein
MSLSFVEVKNREDFLCHLSSHPFAQETFTPDSKLHPRDQSWMQCASYPHEMPSFVTTIVATMTKAGGKDMCHYGSTE